MALTSRRDTFVLLPFGRLLSSGIFFVVSSFFVALLTPRSATVSQVAQQLR
jgi:nitrate reductase gamma subunit